MENNETQKLDNNGHEPQGGPPKEVAPTGNPPQCPTGYYYDEELNKCILDVG